MPDTAALLSPTDCPNCHGVGYLGLSYPDDPLLQSGNFTPPICHWCNNGANNDGHHSPKLSPSLPSSKWTGGHLSSPSPSTESSTLSSCYNQLNGSIPEGWNMVLPTARNHHLNSVGVNGGSSNTNSSSTTTTASSTGTILPLPLPYPTLEPRSFPSSPGSATDLSPSTYSEAKGYFDFIPIHQNSHATPLSAGAGGSSHFDHSPHHLQSHSHHQHSQSHHQLHLPHHLRSTSASYSAPISPGSLSVSGVSVPGSDNEFGGLDTPPLVSPSGTGASRTQNQRDSKARCLKKLDNAMEKLISLLPAEMQLSCKRGRANGLKLVEDYITRMMIENNQLRSEAKAQALDYDRAVSDNRQLRDELARLKMQMQSQYR